MRSLFLSFLLISVSISSCKDDDAPSPAIKANEVSVNINGAPWSAKLTSWANSGGTLQLNSEILADNTSIKLFMPDDTTGTFSFIDDIFTAAYYVGNVWWSNEISGNVEITKNSTSEIEGTFDFDVTSAFNSDTVKLTGGKFYWKF